MIFLDTNLIVYRSHKVEPYANKLKGILLREAIRLAKNPRSKILSFQRTNLKNERLNRSPAGYYNA